MIEQLDLFSVAGAGPVRMPAFKVMTAPTLNGFYYECQTRKFVSFVLGRRHYEIPASRCRLAKDWQQKIMRERSI